ncbi:MAG: DNA polymerase III, partial [Candidatus Blackburnbacteria bacterium]|nr:DNA polymerase III [Candidatus Blackburnbacteria bacterium]
INDYWLDVGQLRTYNQAREEVDKLNSSRESKNSTRVTKVFNSLEVDIRPGGKLAIPEKAFETLDFAVVSIHSSFRLLRDEQTKRILAAVEHPKVKILAHPTGRMLNDREGIDANWDKIFESCLKHNVFLEINSWHARLDLPDQLVHEAVKLGLKLVISTDSHASDQMEMIKFGVSVARRGWAEASDIINTRSFEEVQKLLVA